MARLSPVARRAIIALMLATGAAPALAQAAADLILLNGKIYTDNRSWSNAMAVSKGVIIALGDAASVEGMKGPTTRVVDLGGAAVLPGVHDMHIHPVSAGRQYLECPIRRGAPPPEIKQIVAACVAKRKPGEWIVGRGWDNAVFKGAVQDKSFLDIIAPNNPVYLSAETGHSYWANSLALKLAGITRDTPNPLNGVVERDAKGEPNGMLRETAGALVTAKIPAYTREQNEEGARRAQQELLSFGITSIQDAAADKDTMTAFTDLADKGELKIHVRPCLRWTYSLDGSPAFETLYTNRNLYRRDRIEPTCVKIFTDGVPGEGHTAAMLEPYAHVIAGDRDDSRKFGLLMVPPDVLNRMIARFDADGIKVMSHSTGDAAAREVVDAVEFARKQNGYSGVRHQVGHSNFTTAQDLARGRALGVGFEFSAYLYYWNAVTETYHKAIGDARFERFKPFRESLDAGADTMGASDWSVSPSPNPWLAMETMVTRLPPGQATGKKLAPKEAVTLAEAFDIFTVHSARNWGHNSEIGVLKPGMRADMVVLNQNPFEVPITQVHDTKAKMTFVNGELAYEVK